MGEKTWYERTLESTLPFKEVITDPVPENIYDISTGYHSYGLFNRTVAYLKFKYKGNFEENKFIKEWTSAKNVEAKDFCNWFDINSIKVYRKPDKDYQNATLYLFIDEQSKVVIFYSWEFNYVPVKR